MNYKESLDWLFSQLPMFSRIGAAAYKPGLDRSIALAEHFGNPHRKWKSIHIAGTNGKGSVSSMIASILQAQGYKVGLYTSPHLVDFSERIRINGQTIPAEEVIRFVQQWRECADLYPDKPSFFELTMMMAFRWFADMEVDYAVIEVGMGGRLDSTNIISPILSVITNISRDHAQFLGETLPQIASEKAGIIKHGIPAVIGEADGEVENVFLDKAQQVGAPVTLAYRSDDGITPMLVEMLRHLCPLKGDYQQKNINTVIAAIRQLQNLGIHISTRSIHEGIERVSELTGLRGRWTITQQSPLTISDTGHNEAGLGYNIEQLKRLLSERPGTKLHLVIGFVADKDLEHILPLFPSDALYYLTQADIPRALPYEKLAEKATALGWNHRDFPTVSEAYKAACASAKPDDIIYIGGSTFIVADFYLHHNEVI